MGWVLLHEILCGTARSEKEMEPPSDEALSPSRRYSLADQATFSNSHDYASVTSFNPVDSFQNCFKVLEQSSASSLCQVATHELCFKSCMSQSSMFKVEKYERTGNELRIWSFFVLPLFSFGFS
jgi:hypothetical protein